MFKTFVSISRNLYRLGVLPKLQENIISNNILPNCSSFLNQNNVKFHQKVFYCGSESIYATISGLNEDINVQDLTDGDTETEKKLRVIILEVDVLRQEGLRIPALSFLKVPHWKELLSKESRSQRKRYLEFLWKTEKKKQNEKVKKEQARIERENRPEYVDDGHIRYGLNHNTFLIRIYDTTINQLYNNRLVRAMQFGQQLIVDCGYDDNMTSRECVNCAKQLMLLFAENRAHNDPFDLHLCNADLSKMTMNCLGRHIATLHEPWFPLHIHAQKSYLDVFPKDKLVYLSPHCREELTNYDHDAIYIIGAIVDKVNQEPLSLAKAKRDGIRMAKLPLDRYLQWGSGSGKNLTLNQMISILLDVKSSGDWNHALRHVPRRKITTEVYGGNRQALPYDRRPTQRWHGSRDEKPFVSKDNRAFDHFNSPKTKRTKHFIKQLMES